MTFATLSALLGKQALALSTQVPHSSARTLRRVSLIPFFVFTMEISSEMMHIPLRRHASSGEGNVSIDLDRLESPSTSPRKSTRSGSGEFHTISCTAWLISTLTRALKSLIPRRLDEPTGPFELVTFTRTRLPPSPAPYTNSSVL